jgi:hypothetical protein
MTYSNQLSTKEGESDEEYTEDRCYYFWNAGADCSMFDLTGGDIGMSQV